MSFPQTKHTLIQRLAFQGDDHDWREFLADYWGPICRFTLRGCQVTLAEAEDVAASTFEVVFRTKLLERWINTRNAKLSTLLCSVAARIHANQRRRSLRTKELWEEFAEECLRSGSASSDPAQEELFLASWVDDLLQGCLLQLAEEYHAEGRGDYFRVFYGRICESLTIAEVAGALDISPDSVNNFYRHVRRRLSERLEKAVRSHVYRYCTDDEAESEFKSEWDCMAQFLLVHGGLEEAVRSTHQSVKLERLLAPRAPKPLADNSSRSRASQ